ncbi:MAG: GTP cyclohydrolase, FolE2/MptA family, partial [Candidatus Thermoplasmatota archaeon]|nr:GTP cyclohydrolase, FolE2/MptA family [Candidatus Thermoplasmatota archaeon]
MAVDVQNKVPALRFKLTRVGIRGVRKPVFVERGGKLTTLAANIDVFVDLPASRKGAHMSRNIEAVNEILDRSIEKPVKGVENLCANIAKQLLSKHDY